MNIPRLTFHDAAKLIPLVFWVFTSYAAVIAYGARGRALPSILAFVSGTVTAMIAYDVKMYHLSSSYRPTEVSPSRQFWESYWRMVALVFIAESLVLSLVFLFWDPDAPYQGIADAIWSLIQLFVCCVWYVLKSQNIAAKAPDGAAPSATDADDGVDEATATAV